VFFGCSNVDPHVPKRRVDETAAVLERLGTRVTERIYPGMGHTINADEITATRGILDAVLAGAATAS
jgi:predicted esterase